MKPAGRGNDPLMTALAVVFMLVLLASLAARFWFSEKTKGAIGPTHIAADAQSVYVFASGDLYRLDHAGELLEVYGRDRTGVTGHPIDLRVAADGSLLVAEQRPARIRSCDVKSWDCRLLAALPRTLIRKQFKVLPGKETGSLLITDAQGDTLWLLGQGENEPREVVPGGMLAGPNDLAFDAGGLLWVADTDHRRIVELLPFDEGDWAPGRRHSAVNAFSLAGRHFPMMLAFDGAGRLWVTQAAEFSEPHSDLLVYDTVQGAQGRVELPEGAWATDIVALPDAVLVSDLERFTVYRIDAATLEVSGFGGRALRERLEGLRAQRARIDRYGALSLGAVIFSAVAMLAFAVLATPRKRRWTRPKPRFDWAGAPDSVPRISGVHWLERDPGTERSLKWVERLGFVLFILMVVGGLTLYAWMRAQAGPDPDDEVAAKLHELGMLLLLAGALFALLLPILRLSVRSMKRRLGTDGKRVYVRMEDGRELAADPSELGYTDRLVIFRRYTVPLLGGQQRPIYAPGEVETWLAPLLKQARRLTEWEILRLLLRGKP